MKRKNDSSALDMTLDKLVIASLSYLVFQSLLDMLLAPVILVGDEMFSTTYRMPAIKQVLCYLEENMNTGLPSTLVQMICWFR